MRIKTLLLSLLSLQPTALYAADNPTDLIKIPVGSNLIKTVHAKGVQVYQCVQNSSAYEWEWLAPEAELFEGDNQTPAGNHGTGPTWKYKDGSGVTGKLVEKIDSPDKNSVPWLLLTATGHSGQGLLSQTGFILRFNTQGGLPPTSGCDTNHLGTEAKIPYSADYSFYGP